MRITEFSGATLARNLFPALSIYADVLRRPRLPADQVSAARAVVLNELSSIEDDPAQKVIQELRRRHFPAPWGRPSQGREESVEAIKLKQVKQHVARNYRPNGTIVSVAGRFDWKAVQDHVAKLYSDWASQPAKEPPLGKPGKRLEHLEQESNQTQIGIAYDSVPYRDPDYFQAWGSVGVLSGGMSSRLFTEVREKRGLCYSVYASHQSLRDGRRFCAMPAPAPSGRRKRWTSRSANWYASATGSKPRNSGPLKAQHQERSCHAAGIDLGDSCAAIARDWYYLGRVRTLDELAAIVDGLSRESINAYLADHPPKDFTIVTLGPKPLEVPVGIS